MTPVPKSYPYADLRALAERDRARRVNEHARRVEAEEARREEATRRAIERGARVNRKDHA